MSSKKRSFREKLSAELKRFEQKYIDPSRRSLRLTLRRRAMMIRAVLTYRFRSRSLFAFKTLGADFQMDHAMGWQLFADPRAFRTIRRRITWRPYRPYAIVPMARIEDNSVLLDGISTKPCASIDYASGFILRFRPIASMSFVG